MNSRTASMVVMAAGMACVAGCAEWRNDRADSGYRTIDEDARDQRTDVRPSASKDSRSPNGTGSYAASGDPRSAQTGGPVTTTDGRAYSAASGASSSPGSTGSYTFGGDPQGVQTGGPDARGGDVRTSDSRHTGTTGDRAAVTSGGKVPEKDLTGEVHDHDLKNRTTPANPGERTRSADAVARSSDERTTDGRAGHEAPTGREEGTWTDMRDTRDTGDTRTARESEDPYGVSPDAFGSSPYSPANRGVRVVRYDRRAIEPLHRETSWQSPNYTATTTSTWPRGQNRASTDSRGTTHDNQGRAGDLARMDTQDQSGRQNPTDRDPAWREGAKPDALAARPGPDGKTQIDPTLVGVSPDSRILSVLHAKNLEEVEMGRLAQSKGASADVRRFGEELQKDHGENDRQVQSLASSRSIMLMDAEQLKQLMKGEKEKKQDADGYVSRHDYNQDADARSEAERMARDAAAREAGEPIATPGQPGAKDAMGKEHKEHKDHAAVVAELNGLSGSEFDRRFAEVMLKGHRELIQKVEKCRQEVTPEVGQFLDQTLTTLRKHEQTAQRLTSMR